MKWLNFSSGPSATSLMTNISSKSVCEIWDRKAVVLAIKCNWCRQISWPKYPDCSKELRPAWTTNMPGTSRLRKDYQWPLRRTLLHSDSIRLEASMFLNRSVFTYYFRPFDIFWMSSCAVITSRIENQSRATLMLVNPINNGSRSNLVNQLLSLWRYLLRKTNERNAIRFVSNILTPLAW